MEAFEIEILLATYNGEKYLREQLDSLMKQTYRNFFVTARDDGSNDGTLDILREYQKNYPKVFRKIYENKSNIHGAKENFSALFDLASADYIMCSDQDDVWCENKIKLTMDAMKKAEEQYPGEAILVHTDLYVVDGDLKIIDPSFFHCMTIRPERNRFARFFSENTVTGCTMMINRRLKEIIRHIPQEAVMHDWWAAFCASGMGHICTLYIPTIYYRQHENNTIGVDKDSDSHLKWIMKYLFSKKRIRMIRKIEYENYISVKCFYAYYANQLRSEDKNLCKRFLHLRKLGHLAQLRSILKDDFFYGGFKTRVKYWLMLIR